ncbi:hypothetical protein ACTACV_27550 [Pseudomonas syringae]|uniref:hypothetical protein n=1 Tax=Pseudomonas syringae TaxID=317 RepID=UPI003F74F49A
MSDKTDQLPQIAEDDFWDALGTNGMRRISPEVSVKKTLDGIDEAVLAELLDYARCALNDARAAKKVSKEFGIPLARVQAFAHLAVRLSIEPDREPEITTMAQLYALHSKLASS